MEVSTELGGVANTRRWVSPLMVLLAATIPFVPSLIDFISRGVPDVLLTGDGAVLELGTFRALHGVQLVGPYSRFGWNHPGPAYFYLAAPFYALLGERGAALNVFAFTVDYVCAVAIASLAYRLRGLVFGLLVAALVGAYALIAAPFLMANEWNPILPILPLALLSMLAVAIGASAVYLVPIFVFVASAIVQTHIGFAPEVVALAILVGTTSWPLFRAPESRGWMIATAVVLLVCWALPLYEQFVARPGNLALIVRFFVPKHWTEHSWREAARVVVAQLVAMPDGLLVALRLTPQFTTVVSSAVAAVITLLLLRQMRSRDRAVNMFARVALIEIAVAVLATRAIRGDIEPYLTLWISVVGLFAAIALTAELSRLTAAAYAAIALIALSVSAGVPRSPIVPSANPDADLVAQRVEGYLRESVPLRPTIVIRDPAVWPMAAATILSLTKRGYSVAVSEGWVHVFGPAFVATSGEHPVFTFVESGTSEQPTVMSELVVRSSKISVYRDQ